MKSSPKELSLVVQQDDKEKNLIGWGTTIPRSWTTSAFAW